LKPSLLEGSNAKRSRMDSSTTAFGHINAVKKKDEPQHGGGLANTTSRLHRLRNSGSFYRHLLADRSHFEYMAFFFSQNSATTVWRNAFNFPVDIRKHAVAID